MFIVNGVSGALLHCIDFRVATEAGVGTGKLLNATAGVLDIFGSHSDNCSVIGIPVGFTISSESGKEPISGGFVGYADLGRMSNCNVENIKKVASDQIA